MFGKPQSTIVSHASFKMYYTQHGKCSITSKTLIQRKCTGHEMSSVPLCRNCFPKLVSFRCLAHREMHVELSVNLSLNLSSLSKKIKTAGQFSQTFQRLTLVEVRPYVPEFFHTLGRTDGLNCRN
jgi:hypothetical protein